MASYKRPGPVPFSWVLIGAAVVLSLLYYTAAYSDPAVFAQQAAVRKCQEQGLRALVDSEGGIRCERLKKKP